MHWASWESWRQNLRFGQTTPTALNVADFASFLYQNPGARKAWTTYIERRESHRLYLAPEEYERNRFADSVVEDLVKLDQRTND